MLPVNCNGDCADEKVSSSEGDVQNPDSDLNPEPNPDSIDQSLDAIESQLASISMSSRSPTATIDDEVILEEEEQSVEQLTISNGPLNEEIKAERAVDPVEDEHIESNLKADASRGSEENVSSAWRNVLEARADELERPQSPSSSGYAAERGSSSGGDEISNNGVDANEIHEVANDGDLGSHAQWISGKRHPEEDDASVSWRKRKKHFFILSHSGKPIYSRYGDEHKLAGFSATLQAIISFVENGRPGEIGEGW
ncbi:hypothetical protein OROGR_024569 [Orobanche gracilis]